VTWNDVRILVTGVAGRGVAHVTVEQADTDSRG